MAVSVQAPLQSREIIPREPQTCMAARHPEQGHPVAWWLLSASAGVMDMNRHHICDGAQHSCALRISYGTSHAGRSVQCEGGQANFWAGVKSRAKFSSFFRKLTWEQTALNTLPNKLQGKNTWPALFKELSQIKTVKRRNSQLYWIMPAGVLLGKEPGKTVQCLAQHSWVFNAIFGSACDVRPHCNLMLWMLTRKLHTTKLLLFSPVTSLWLISGQGAALKASTWLISHLRHTGQHKAYLKIPCLLRTHCTRRVELCYRDLLLHYLKLLSVSQYWLLKHPAAGIQSFTKELYKEHFLTMSTPFTTRFCYYRRFWNVNALQARLPGTIHHLARFSPSFNTIEISLPGTEPSWATNYLIKDYRVGEDDSGQQ